MRTVAFLALVLACGCEAAREEEAPKPDVLAWMRTLADDASAERRAVAARQLGATFPGGARGVPLLVAARDDGDAAVRQEVDKALENLGGAALDRLAGWLLLDWGEGQERYDRPATQILDLGGRSSPQEDATSIRSVPHPGWAILPSIAMPIWNSPDPRFPPYGMYALFERMAGGPTTGPGAEGTLTAACALGAAGRAMLALGDRPVPARVLQLASHESRVRRWAALWLLVVSRSSRAGVRETLAKLTGDPFGLIAGSAARRLLDLDRREPAKVEDVDVGLAEIVIARLESAGKRARIPETLQYLPDPDAPLDPALRHRLLLALVRLRAEDHDPFLSPGAVPWLLAPASRDPEVAEALTQRFERILEVSGPLLAKHPDVLEGIAVEGWRVLEAYEARYTVLDVLGRMGAAARVARPTIEPLTASPDLLLRYLARLALLRIGPA